MRPSTLLCASAILGLVAAAPMLGQTPARIPDAVVRAAHEALAARLGDSARAVALFTYRPELALFVPPNPECPQSRTCWDYEARPSYQLFFEFRVPGHADLRPLVPMLLDSTGHLAAGPGLPGVPRCAESAQECAFPIDSAAARAIARRAGLAEGQSPWRLAFGWSGAQGFDVYGEHAYRFHTEPGRFESYVWSVENTVEVESGAWFGEIILIDANSGQVLTKLQYTAQE